MTSLRSNLIPFAILIAAFMIAGGVFTASAEEKSSNLQGVTFPVAELGNCADQGSCKTYCNDSANMPACVEFAKSHGLISQAEADRGKIFAEQLKKDGGPGGCKSAEECKVYCENVANLKACIEFAKKHKLNDERTAEAEKLTKYIAEGGETPGKCSSKEACQAYCQDFAHGDECRAFAEKAGLTTSQGKNVVPPGQFQKLTSLAKEGKTPGRCTSAESCKAYCQDAAHRTECIAFGKEAGLIEEHQADALERTGGVGPGGCTSADACRAYCNDQAHRDECFQFAEEHNLISKEKLAEAKDGLVRFRQGLDTAPEGVVACLKSSVGENIIADIQAGKLTPGADIGERAKACFEKFGKKVDTTDEIKRAGTDVVACFKEKAGIDPAAVKSGSVAFTPELADALRLCNENMKFFGETKPLMGKATSTQNTQNASEDVRFVFERAPREVQACIKEKLGTPSGTPTEQVKAVFRGCFDSFKPGETARPMSSPSSATSSRAVPQANPFTTPVARPGSFPPAIADCLKTNLAPADFDRLLKGTEVSGTVKEIVTKCMNAAQTNVPTTGTLPPPPKPIPEGTPLPPPPPPLPADGTVKPLEPTPPTTAPTNTTAPAPTSVKTPQTAAPVYTIPLEL
ncbi:hypothetical protein KW797_00765 [Candidatus Parcubacteria bacterium]|nr:hypothetical protein [Candidatus Parcubacteria bacterium]